MIRIKVDGKYLALQRNTSLTVELNNALFGSPDIEGDISFPFTLPVEGNEIIFEFAHLSQCNDHKSLPCVVYCDGGFSWNGRMIAQKTSYNTITAALVINPYPEGFAGRGLTANEDGDIVISESKEMHDAAWEGFIKASVNDPDVKFAPFFNTDGYGSANDNWGIWHGNSRRKIVNALFFTPAGVLINSDGFPFSKAHCEMVTLSSAEDSAPIYEMNQLAFCPQVRIARVMELWCRNAGYKFINHLGDDLNGTFLQSQKSLDGTAAQFEVSGIVIGAETYNILNTGEDWHYLLNEIGDTGHVTTDGDIKPTQTGWWELQLEPMFENVQASYILFQQGQAAGWPYSDEIQEFGYMMAVYSGNVNLQQISNENTMFMWKYNGSGRIIKMFVTDDLLVSGFRLVMFYKKKYGNDYKYQAANLMWSLSLHHISEDGEVTGFNIFRSKFRIPEVLPSVSNASFLKTMMETMGLCYFVSGKLKSIEMVPYAMLKQAASIDLTAYELTRETETDYPEETMRTFRLAPLKDETYNEDLRLPDTEMELPDAYFNHEHLILRTKTNTLYRATKLESETQNWTEHWEEHSGNPDRLKLGSGKEERREPGVKIPHQRLWANKRPRSDLDVMTNEVPQMMVADVTISSDLYNPSDTPSDIILTQYRGFRERTYEGAGHVKNEVMLPVWNNEFSLTANGANSIGEKYVKPVLDLIGHRKVTYKFRLPTSMMQAVEDLLRPSELEPSMQTRFLIVRNVKTVPKKITFQIDNDRDDTVLCQIEAVKVY